MKLVLSLVFLLLSLTYFNIQVNGQSPSGLTTTFSDAALAYIKDVVVFKSVLKMTYAAFPEISGDTHGVSYKATNVALLELIVPQDSSSIQVISEQGLLISLNDIKGAVGMDWAYRQDSW